MKRTQDLTIRTAVVADHKVLEALQRRASFNNAGDREALLANPGMIELPLRQIEDGSVFVADVGGSIKGFAAIFVREDGSSELDALFVEPEHWRRGIGHQLVDFCCLVAKGVGSLDLYVIGNPHAQGFYEASGFVTLGMKQMQFGTGLLMKRALT